MPVVFIEAPPGIRTEVKNPKILEVLKKVSS